MPARPYLGFWGFRSGQFHSADLFCMFLFGGIMDMNGVERIERFGITPGGVERIERVERCGSSSGTD